MRNLRHARRLWAARVWLTVWPTLTYEEWLAAAGLLRTGGP
jgi:hypothetical protein